MQGKESRPYTLNDYNKVIQLRKKGLTFEKIIRTVGVSHTTAVLWVNTSRKPRFLYAKRKQRKLPKSAKIMSPELAYIYGVLIGDGSIESKHSYRINLNVNDKDFAYAFAKALERWSQFKPTINVRRALGNHQTKYGNWIRTNSFQYVVRLGSKQGVNFLLDNLKCRTYDWEVPASILNSKNEKIKCDFLRGFFDSEGSVLYNPKTNKKRIDLTIFETKGIKSIQLILGELGIRSTLTKGKHGTCVLRILDKNSLKIFLDKISFSILRKKYTLEKAINSYTIDVYDGAKVRKDILNSIKNQPKTIREISKPIGKHYNATKYHLKKLNKIGKVKVVGRITKNKVNYSNLWEVV